MNAALEENGPDNSGHTNTQATATRVGRAGHRAISRVLTLVLAVGLAVVGTAGAASAHHNTITGWVECAEEGGWAVTWKVVNSEHDKSETITASNREWVVPVGTTLEAGETKYFTETVTTKPTSTVTLTLSAKWSNGYTKTDDGHIYKDKFYEDCNVTTVDKPQVPVIDECGPGNARYGAVPEGPWTSVVNPDGSLTITANEGYTFPHGKTSFSLPKPTDSNTPCPASVPTVPVIDACGPGNAHYGTVPNGPWTSVLNPDGSLTITANPGYSFPDGQTITLPAPADSNVACPVVTPPVVTPPVVTPPEVLPAQVRVVRAKAKRIDKCGRASDLFKVSKRRGVIYKVKGKVVREGVWLKAKTRKVVVRAKPADGTYALQGKRVWKMKFTRKPCAQAPEISPNTGS